MPVKVRCPSCDKVLNAPDSVRGKSVKCPGCETKIRVPEADSEATSGSGAQKAAAPAGGPRKASTSGSGPQKVVKKDAKTPPKSKSGDSAEFFTNINMNEAEDRSTRVCRKCGAKVEEEDIECPACGVDIQTGQMSAAKKLKASRKGPDPAEFYSEAWKNSFEFLLANKSLAIKTVVLTMICVIGAAGSAFLVAWCTRTPPKVFWAFGATLFYLMVPGWYWFLTTEVIRETLRKKKVLKDVHIDLFLCMALGLKSVAWSFAFFLPVVLITMAGRWVDNKMVIVIIDGIVTLAMLPMLPLVMIHMTMPVTWRGWSAPHMAVIFARNAVPALYWCLVAFCAHLAAYLCVGLMVFLAIQYGLPILATMGIAATQQMQEFGVQRADVVTWVVWTMFGLMIVLYLVALLMFALAAVFSMRAIGLLAYYFRDNMDLVTEVAEKEYVAIKRDEFGMVIEDKNRDAKVKAAWGGGGLVFYMVVNVISATLGGPVFLPRWLAIPLRLVQDEDAAPPAAAAPPAGGAPAAGAAPAAGGAPAAGAAPAAANPPAAGAAPNPAAAPAPAAAPPANPAANPAAPATAPPAGAAKG